MSGHLSVNLKHRPVLDPEFQPASLWNGFYDAMNTLEGCELLAIALERGDGGVSVYRTAILRHEPPNAQLNYYYTERLLKYLLWQRGGCRITISGEPRIAEYLRAVYSPTGARAFDYNFMGKRVYGRPMTIEQLRLDRYPLRRDGGGSRPRTGGGCLGPSGPRSGGDQGRRHPDSQIRHYLPSRGDSP